jgi:hypothetical protein
MIARSAEACNEKMDRRGFEVNRRLDEPDALMAHVRICGSARQ